MVTDIVPDYPQSTYKFYSNLEHNREALIENYLFVSHPYHLNDLMDGEVYTIDMRKVSVSIYEKMKQQILAHSPAIVEKAFMLKLYPQIDLDRIQLQAAIMSSFFSYGGIVSLATSNRFSELMWAHYTQESGFLIEFDTKSLLDSIVESNDEKKFSKLYFRKIHYRPHPISISCIETQSVEKINLFNATQKNWEWSYEREWRIILSSKQHLGLPDSVYVEDKEITDVSKRKAYYHNSAIKRIYLGKKFWSTCIEKREIIPRNSDKVRVYKVKTEFIPFVRELCKYQGRVYMSGTCDYSEYRHGTDSCFYNQYKGIYDFDPERYYITRGFELIEKMEIIGKDVYVIYSGTFLIRDESFFEY